MNDLPYPVTSVIAAFAAQADVGQSGGALRERSRIALLDTLASAIAGRSEPGGAIGQAVMADQTSPGAATVWATGAQVNPAVAAFLNGLSGHVHDYDDMTDPLIGHPSVGLWPTLLALGQDRAVSGAALLDAYAVGYQIDLALDRALPVGPHFRQGWHSTSTVGVIAATAAGGRLAGLDAAQIAHAIGVAASTASGSRANFGSDTKSLHTALMAYHAVLAVRLAEAGFTANPAQLEAPAGYFAVFGPTGQPASVGAALHGPWGLLNPQDRPRIKPYPSCGSTHRPIAAALPLAAQLAGRTDRVGQVTVTVPPGAFTPLIQHRPVTSLQGKFSAEYAVAAALLDGQVGLRSFTDQAVGRSAAQALLRKVALRESASPPFDGPHVSTGYATVEVEVDGQILRGRADDLPELPPTRAALTAKLADCLDFVGLDWSAPAIAAELWSLSDQSALGPWASLAPERPLPAPTD
ncbi:MAG: MmgE/PrpD family protein [Propionibacteriaceae bacterium]|jgi:2-methylcitrate dehydratase PrpD|nr:MmgE/PrpD family protein [Propionibacteriaceae bacterium]